MPVIETRLDTRDAIELGQIGLDLSISSLRAHAVGTQPRDAQRDHILRRTVHVGARATPQIRALHTQG